MADLTTTYLGLTLKNPLIAASSGLTDSVKNIKKLEESGIGAVVLKSIFEEEILLQETSLLQEAERNPLIYSALSETLDYIDLHVKEETVSNYLSLIKEAKKSTFIPIIASINCITGNEWTEFAKKVAEAGADAIELNIFLNPSDTSNKNFEDEYYNICRKIVDQVNIPVSVKVSKYFTKPAQTIKKIASSGVKGIVLFNRFYTPDIDIHKLEVTTTGKISSTTEYYESLKWIGTINNDINCDLAASNGIHSTETIIKLILAGASGVQLCSLLYEQGVAVIPSILSEIDEWMDNNKFNYLDQVKGLLSLKNENQAAYERTQFMKYFSGI